jgi:electron transfer flavoprotein alpha subunit
MPNALVVAELSEDGKLKQATLAAIASPKRLPAVGGAFSILVLGRSAKAAARELAATAPPSLVCEDPRSRKYTAEHYAPTVARAAQGLRARRRDRHEPGQGL